MVLDPDIWDALQLLALRDGCGDAKDYIYKLIDSEVRLKG